MSRLSTATKTSHTNIIHTSASRLKRLYSTRRAAILRRRWPLAPKGSMPAPVLVPGLNRSLQKSKKRKHCSLVKHRIKPDIFLFLRQINSNARVYNCLRAYTGIRYTLARGGGPMPMLTMQRERAGACALIPTCNSGARALVASPVAGVLPVQQRRLCTHMRVDSTSTQSVAVLVRFVVGTAS